MANIQVKVLLVRALAVWGAVTLLLLALGLAGMFFAAKWLRAADSPERVDAMIVLAGAPERAMYAADLFRQGFSPVVYISKPSRENAHRKLEQFGIVLPTEEFVNRTILNKGGVDDQHIKEFSRGSVNTLDEARTLRAALPQNTRAIMIVTSPYHVRRVKMVFEEIFSGSGINVRVVASPYEYFPDRWWTDREATLQTILEVMKITFYQLGGSYSRGGQ